MSSIPTPDGASSPRDFALGVDGFHYSDLWDESRLRDLTEAYYRAVEAADSTLLSAWRTHQQKVQAGRESIPAPEESELLVRMAEHLSRFVAKAFRVESELAALRARVEGDKSIFRMKTDFMARRTFKKGTAPKASADDFPALDEQVGAMMRRAFPALAGGADAERSVAEAVVALLDAEKILAKNAKTPDAPEPLPAPLAGILPHLRAALAAEDDLAAAKAALDLLERWSFARSVHPEGRKQVKDWVSYRHPHSLDYASLVPTDRPDAALPEATEGPQEHRRRRDGFKLTDRRATFREVEAEIEYCLYCHAREKDSCSTGFAEKGEGAGEGSAKYRKNPLGIPLTGCPLDEKISEAHLLKARGDSLAALAVITVDNPMAPGTGHRICNDCMKSCVFQKQEPVNIPQAETGILTDVLNLPWGVEIYGLLARWNPLDAKRPWPRAYTGKNVLVVGMGPAGYTLAHYLLNEGFGVVGIDGLKVEPLPDDLVGANGALPRPVKHLAEITTELDDRILSGFGGVSEYGITVRWDKNFLTLLQLTLERRRRFKLYGGVRFGGTVTLDDAWELGFDHVALAAGAGRPTIIRMKNNLIRGIRKASDFLMALQLTGAFKKNSMANLQVQLPAVVIGGGLTGIDTATEIAAYYPVQVEKALERWERLVAEGNEPKLAQLYRDAGEKAILDEFLAHGREVRAERERAAAAGEEPDFAPLVRRWGGVHLVYRKSLSDSPAYRLNHEEVVKAFEEGIRFVERMSPVEAVPDATGAVSAIRFERQAVDEAGKWKGTGEIVPIAARTVCVAAGTSPNVTYEKEFPGTFELDEWKEFFRPYMEVEGPDGTVALEPAPKNDGPKGARAFFTSYRSKKHPGRFVSYYGDNHPVYAGNVVKAMASAKDGYPHVVNLFRREIEALDPKRQAERDARWDKLTGTLDDALRAKVVEVRRLTPTIIEVIVQAKWAARKFQPGQFYRLQNFERLAPVVDGTRLQMEGIALTGAWTDPEQGLLSLIVLEMGGSSRLCATLVPGQPIVVMGPTGAPTEIPKNEDVALVGGGLGNAVLFSIAKALKDNGCRVLYFAGYKKAEDLFKRDEIEQGTDLVVWSTDPGSPAIPPRRPQDRSFTGNIVQSMAAYAAGELGEPAIPLSGATRMIVIGSDRMMAAVKEARKTVLAPFLRKDCEAIGSINSPMQCMMKEICAQCLQRHVDPVTGKETFVFSCFNQDQRLDDVDFANLNERLRANGVLEKLTNAWLDRLLALGLRDGSVKLTAVQG